MSASIHNSRSYLYGAREFGGGEASQDAKITKDESPASWQQVPPGQEWQWSPTAYSTLSPILQ